MDKFVSIVINLDNDSCEYCTGDKVIGSINLESSVDKNDKILENYKVESFTISLIGVEEVFYNNIQQAVLPQMNHETPALVSLTTMSRSHLKNNQTASGGNSPGLRNSSGKSSITFLEKEFNLLDDPFIKEKITTTSMSNAVNNSKSHGTDGAILSINGRQLLNYQLENNALFPFSFVLDRSKSSSSFQFQNQNGDKAEARYVIMCKLKLIDQRKKTNLSEEQEEEEEEEEEEIIIEGVNNDQRSKLPYVACHSRNIFVSEKYTCPLHSIESDHHSRSFLLSRGDLRAHMIAKRQVYMPNEYLHALVYINNSTSKCVKSMSIQLVRDLTLTLPPSPSKSSSSSINNHQNNTIRGLKKHQIDTPYSKNLSLDLQGNSKETLDIKIPINDYYDCTTNARNINITYTLKVILQAGNLLNNVQIELKLPIIICSPLALRDNQAFQELLNHNTIEYINNNTSKNIHLDSTPLSSSSSGKSPITSVDREDYNVENNDNILTSSIAHGFDELKSLAKTTLSSDITKLTHDQVIIKQNVFFQTAKSYYFDVSDRIEDVNSMTLTIEVISTNDISIHARYQQPPLLVKYDIANSPPEKNNSTSTQCYKLTINRYTSPRISKGRWFFEVIGKSLLQSSDYSIVAKLLISKRKKPIFTDKHHIEEVFEVQNRSTPFSRFQRSTSYPAYTDKNNIPCPPKEDIGLPDSNWYWNTKWLLVNNFETQQAQLIPSSLGTPVAGSDSTLDTFIDSEYDLNSISNNQPKNREEFSQFGWQYAISFNSDSWKNNCLPVHFIRRRKWIRHRILKSKDMLKEDQLTKDFVGVEIEDMIDDFEMVKVKKQPIPDELLLDSLNDSNSLSSSELVTNDSNIIESPTNSTTLTTCIEGEITQSVLPEIKENTIKSISIDSNDFDIENSVDIKENNSTSQNLQENDSNDSNDSNDNNDNNDNNEKEEEEEETLEQLESKVNAEIQVLNSAIDEALSLTSSQNLKELQESELQLQKIKEREHRRSLEQKKQEELARKRKELEDQEFAKREEERKKRLSQLRIKRQEEARKQQEEWAAKQEEVRKQIEADKRKLELLLNGNSAFDSVSTTPSVSESEEISGKLALVEESPAAVTLIENSIPQQEPVNEPIITSQPAVIDNSYDSDDLFEALSDSDSDIEDIETIMLRDN